MIKKLNFFPVHDIYRADQREKIFCEEMICFPFGACLDNSEKEPAWFALSVTNSHFCPVWWTPEIRNVHWACETEEEHRRLGSNININSFQMHPTRPLERLLRAFVCVSGVISPSKDGFCEELFRCCRQRLFLPRAALCSLKWGWWGWEDH